MCDENVSILSFVLPFNVRFFFAIMYKEKILNDFTFGM